MADSERVLIQARNLCKAYSMGTPAQHGAAEDQTVHALRDVSLDIAEGDFVAIMGASGSGKSTLMNILGCLDVPTSGTYHLAGVAVEGMGQDALASVRNQRIGFVFQQFNLLPRTSALENVELPMVYSGIKANERHARALQALQRVGLGERLGHTPAELSGGQQQRVAIARALVNQPQLILADEPTGALDSQTSEDIMQLLTALNQQGMTVVLVTHEADIAAWARRKLVFKDGQLVQDTCSDPRSGAASGGTASAAGPSQGARAPSGGSDPRSGAAWGGTASAAGPSQGARAPSGGSDPRSGGAWG
jgi:putative ABC transport system ATP-binding protein